jgi:hypothetical protein
MAAFERLDKQIMPKRLKAGLAAAGHKLMVDTVEGLPTTPIKRPGYSPKDKRIPGELRASGATFVNGVRTSNSVVYGEGATGMYKPTIYGGEPITPGNYEACVVFNAPYAAIQHEQFPSKTQRGAGTHYLSEKLYGNAEEYIAIIASAARL